MRWGIITAAALGLLAASIQDGTAAPAERRGAISTELSSQASRPPTRLRVYPRGGRLLYRDCYFRLVQQWRPSGTVIVPREHCWWVRG
jgi:hypothetical protein